MWVGGCLAVMAQWQCTRVSSQWCPGFDSRCLLDLLFSPPCFCCVTFKCCIVFVSSTGQPSAPTLSCIGLSRDVNGTVNVTVSWTLSGGDSYIIKTTTKPSIIIPNPTVTQYELTGFMAGYEYSITVHGVNCGDLEGRESEPITIKPQRMCYL